jgi:hypothetical protein
MGSPETFADSWPQLQDAVRIFIGTPNHDGKRLCNGPIGPKYGFLLQWSAVGGIRVWLLSPDRRIRATYDARYRAHGIEFEGPQAPASCARCCREHVFSTPY